MDLIKRYVNEMILVDATYKTTRYTLPLMFIVVKTNVDYQTEAISEAVAVIKS